MIILAALFLAAANICLAGIFFAFWWLDRQTRAALQWSGGFAALAGAVASIAFARENPGDLAVAITIALMGLTAGLLFGGTRLHTGRSASGKQVLSWVVLVWLVLGLCRLIAPDLVDDAGSLLLAALFGWIGILLLAEGGFSRIAGGLFLGRAAVVAVFPLLPDAAAGPSFVLLHFLSLATGLALLLAAFVRTNDRLAAERAEREKSAERLRRLQDDEPAILVVVDTRGNIASVSNDWLAFTGFSRAEVVGRPGNDFVSPESAAREMYRAWRAIGSNTTIDSYAHDLVCKDGALRPVVTSVRNRLNVVTGEPEMIALSVDQSARQAAEDKARHERALLDHIVDVLPAAVTVKDRQLRLTLWNAHATRLFGRTSQDILGKRLSDVSPGAVSEHMEDVDRAVLRGELPPAHETLVDVTSEPRWIMMRKVPLSLSEGVIDGVISASLDITDLKRTQADLQESRELLVQAQRIGRTGYMRSDFRTNRVIWSDTLFEWRGVAPVPFFTFDQALSFVHPDDREIYSRAREEGLANKRPYEATTRVVRPDGGIIWERSIGHPVSDASGQVTGIMLFIQDITAVRQAEMALRASETKFVQAFQGSTDLMAFVSAGTTAYVEVNDAWLATSGYRRDEVIGQTPEQLGIYVEPDDLLRIRGQMREHGSVPDVEASFRRKDGKTIEVVMSGTRVEVDGSVYYFWSGRDVTEEKRIRREIDALSAANERALRQIRNITDNLPVLISHADRSRRCTFINRTGEEWFARPASELLGRRLLDFLEEYNPGFSTQPIQHILLTGGRAIVERTIRYPDGKLRNTEITYIADMGADGDIHGYYTLTTDISDRRATEEQLRQSQKMEAVGQLSGGIAHDFNNLLGVISGNLEMALGEIAAEGELYEMLTSALRAAARGASLTRSMLAFARRQPLAPAAVDMSVLVQDMTDLIRRTLPPNIDMEVIPATGLWRCEADAGQLQNALVNLVVNSRDAMPDGGKLTIETSNVQLDDDYAAAHVEVAPGQYVVLAVSDTGSGMQPEILARAFDPFFTTKGVGRGTGLGLSMVYGFAKQSHGHVKIYSEPGQGTTVRLYLPRTHAEIDDVVDYVPADLGGKGETILVVEDNPDFRTLTFALLRSFGYEVLDAGDAASALDRLDHHPEVALLLTDIVLPGGMNGERLAIAARDRRPDLPVVFMSGYTEDAVQHQGRLDPGVRLLQKPFRKIDLAARVRAALDQRLMEDAG